MARKTQIGDYSPDEDSRAKAVEYWRRKDRQDLIADLEDVIEQFQAHHLAKGTLFISWPMGWKTWYINAPRFQKKPQQRAEPRSFQSHSERYTRPSFKASDHDSPHAVTNLKPVNEILAKFGRGLAEKPSRPILWKDRIWFISDWV